MNNICNNQEYLIKTVFLDL